MLCLTSSCVCLPLFCPVVLPNLVFHQNLVWNFAAFKPRKKKRPFFDAGSKYY